VSLEKMSVSITGKSSRSRVPTEPVGKYNCLVKNASLVCVDFTMRQ